MSDFKIEGEVDVDIASFTRSMKLLQIAIDASGGKVDELDKEIDKLSGKEAKIKISASVKEVTADIAEIKAEVQKLESDKIELGAAIEIDPLSRSILKEKLEAISIAEKLKVIADIEIAKTAAAKVKEEIKALARTDAAEVKLKLKVDKDSAAKAAAEIGFFTRAMSATQTSMGVASTGAMGFTTVLTGAMIPALVVLATVALPAVGVALGGAAGLVGMLGIAGAGVAAFAAFAIPAFKNITSEIGKFEKGQKAIEAATTTTQLNAALAKQQALLKGMDPTVHSFVQSWENFNITYKAIAKTLEPQVFAIANSGLTMLTTLMKLFAPIAAPVADAINSIVKGINTGLHSQEWQSFFGYIKDTAGPMIGAFGTIFGNLFTGIASLIVNFDPLTKQMTGGLVSITKAFADWAAGLDRSKAFKDFVDWMKINSPIIWGDIWKILTALWNLGAALTPFGSKLLELVMPLINLIGNFSKLHITADGTATMFKSLGDVWNNVSNAAKNFWNGLVNIYNVLKNNGSIESFKNAFKDLFSAISTFLQGSGPAIVQLIGVAFVAAWTIATTAISAVAGVLKIVVTAFSSLPGPVQQITIAFAALAFAVDSIGQKALLAKGPMNALQTMSAGLSTTFRAQAAAAWASLGPYALVAAAVVGVAWGLSKMMGSEEDVKIKSSDLQLSLRNLANTGEMVGKGADIYTGKFKNASGAIERTGASITKTGASFNNTGNLFTTQTVKVDETVKAWSRWKDMASSLDTNQFSQWVQGNTGNIDDFKSAVAQSDTALAAMVKGGHMADAKIAFENLAEKTGLSGKALEDYKKMFPEFDKALIADADATYRASVVGTDLATSFRNLGKDTSYAKDNLDVFLTSLQAVQDKALGNEASNDAITRTVQSSVKRVKDAVAAGDKNARSLKGDSQSALDNRESMRRISQDYTKQLEDYTTKHPNDQAGIKNEAVRLTGNFDKQIKDMGFNLDQAKRYKAALDSIPAVIPVELTLPGFDSVMTRIAQANAALAALNNNTYNLTHLPAATTYSLTHLPSVGQPSYGVRAPGSSVGNFPMQPKNSSSTNSTTTNQPVNIYGPVNVASHADLLAQSDKERRLAKLGNQ